MYLAGRGCLLVLGRQMVTARQSRLYDRESHHHREVLLSLECQDDRLVHVVHHRHHVLQNDQEIVLEGGFLK